MRLKLKRPYLSIKQMDDFDLPDFSVLVGRNGVGKTQLLDAVAQGSISVEGWAGQRIEKFDMNSFQPKDSGRAGWSDSTFPQGTIMQYFAGTSGDAPVKVARDIFEKVLRDFGLDETEEEQHNFENILRGEIKKLSDFQIFGDIQGNDAVRTYSSLILREVLGNLSPEHGSRGRRDNVRGNPAVLVSLAMKLSGKLPHELSPEDISRAARYEGGTIANQLSQIFTNYKVGQYSWAHTESEASEKSVQALMAEYRENNCPPWVTLREHLDQMRQASDDPELFNFEFSDPEGDRLIHPDHQQYTFEAKFTNRSTGDSYSVESLSSGEKILISLCLATFNKAMGRRQPALVLLDELDAVLHPSMISALLAGLKDLFVSNGTRVIMATHSVTTVSMLEEGEIYRVMRTGGRVAVQPVSKAEAVSELSEGLATIDTGLRILASKDPKPITILTEGNNALHLKKWANLFYPDHVGVFDGLPDKTGKNQLLTYGQLLDKMDVNSHFLIVWDCDAEAVAKKLSGELGGSRKVTAFSFKEHENQIANNGIENKYDEDILEDYTTIASDAATGHEISRSMSGQNKKDFAQHVVSEGTPEYFRHFGDFEEVVEKILEKIQDSVISS